MPFGYENVLLILMEGAALLHEKWYSRMSS
jgi:hypothetical protein